MTLRDFFDWDVLNREFSVEERERLAKQGDALSDGSFPIVNREDLENAIQAIGRAKDPDKAKAHIKKRARELGAEELIPEEWGGPKDSAVRRPKMRNKADWFRIENKAGSAAEVFIYDEIGDFGTSCNDFLNQVRDLDGDLALHLNSPGGDVFDGLTIYQSLKNRSGRVTVHIDGLAASIASVIAMGADHVIMAPKAQMMIHEGWTAAMGDSRDFRKLADMLDRTSDSIASVYAEKAGQTTEFWRDRMREETWYTADEALCAGLVDEVEGKARKREDFDLSMYAHAGRDKAPQPVLDAQETEQTVEEVPAPRQTPVPVLVNKAQEMPAPEVEIEFDPTDFRDAMSRAADNFDWDPDIFREAVKMEANNRPAVTVKEKEPEVVVESDYDPTVITLALRDVLRNQSR